MIEAGNSASRSSPYAVTARTPGSVARADEPLAYSQTSRSVPDGVVTGVAHRVVGDAVEQPRRGREQEARRRDENEKEQEDPALERSRRRSSAAADTDVTSVLAQAQDAADADRRRTVARIADRDAQRDEDDEVESDDAIPRQVDLH